MDKSDRHIILYAKGHYRQQNPIDDLKKILSERNGIEPRYIDMRDIFQKLSSLAWYFINKESDFIDFVSLLNPKNAWQHCHSKEYEFILISKCLSVLRFQLVDNIPFELGKPDPNILPLIKKENE